jgi:hypothetical protein
MLDHVDARSLAVDWPILGTSMPLELRLSAAANRSASDGSRNFAERNQALWNAIEFYVAKSDLPRLISKSRLRELKRAVKAVAVSDAEYKRAAGLLGGFNNPPLLEKLAHCAKEDGAPLSDEEFTVLKGLRDSRNDVAHGRQATSTSAEELDHAASIVARLIMFRWHRIVEQSDVRR